MRSLLCFTYHEALSCLFAVAIFCSMAVTKWVSVPGVARYDVILLTCILVQGLMFWSGMETLDELKVITLFHIIGFTLEVYKVHTGSWAYPDHAWSKLLGVPLYSGFMYASVASYLVQAWRRLDLEIYYWPRARYTVLLSGLIYLNFFTDHFFYDMRWIYTALLAVLFFRTSVSFALRGVRYRMPLLASFFLIGFFIWIAENISTFFGAYRYPDQHGAWHIVHAGKISSWFLLVIISVMIVAQLKKVKAGLQPQQIADDMVSEDT